MRDVPIPERMQHLPRDRRGLPVPAIVMRDQEGRPHFAINDTEIVMRMLQADRCHVCGTPLLRGRWFVGGPLSALHPDGLFQDGPTHGECLHYALRVCPYLAAPSWSKSVITDDSAPAGALYVDHTTIPDRPKVFVAVLARGAKLLRAEINGVLRLKPHRPYIRVEFWRQGEQLDMLEGAEIAAPIVRAGIEAQRRQDARVIFRRKKTAR